jgi:outer membrane protein assembly factor BamB
VAEKWKFPTDGTVVPAPLVVDDNVYFGSADHRFYSVSAETGEENWSFHTGGVVGGSAAYLDRVLFIPSGHSGRGGGDTIKLDESGKIYAVGAEDGTGIWSVERKGGIQTSLLAHEGLVYHGCQDTRFYALDAETGEEVWRFKADDYFCGSRASLKDGLLYVGCEDNSLYALNSEDGSLVWEFETGDIIASSPVATEDAVYFGSYDGNLYAADTDTGEELWRFETDWSIFSSPAYKDGVVYVGSTDYNMYAIDAETGDAIWSYGVGEKIHSSPVVAGDTVYFGTDDGEVKALRNVPVTKEEYEEWLDENPIESDR